MIFFDLPCDRCKHSQLKDGGNMVCDAFPNGIPSENIFNKNEDELKICNNNVGFEAKREKFFAE